MKLIIGIIGFGLGVVTGIAVREHNLLTMADLKTSASVLIARGRRITVKQTTPKQNT
jgi:hypothetical protein